MVAGERGCLDANAFFHTFDAEVGAPRPGGNGDVRADGGSGDAHRFRAVENDWPDVAGFELIGAHDFLVRFDQGLFVVGHLHLEDESGVEQAVGVLFEPENRCALGGLVGADAFENTHPVVQGMRQHVRRGVAPIHQFAVVPDEAVAIRHGHVFLSSCRTF